MKLKSLLLFAILTASPTYAGTISGTLQGPSGLPVRNTTITFQLQQAGLLVGTGNIAQLSSQCYTSNDGSVVGLPNPLQSLTLSTGGAGSAPVGTYYVEYTFYTASSETLPSAEMVIQLPSMGSINVPPPTSGIPPGATGMRVYMGNASGQEFAQGQTVGTGTYIQTAAVNSSGALVPTTNSTVCTIAFNDTIIPYTGYNVSLISASGNAYPGWPQAWQLNGGPSGTINVSSGAPLWNGTVIYPMPILSQPLNHGPQSISGLLNMTGYNLLNVGAIGIGTSTPAWAVDAVTGFINTNFGYLYQGTHGNTGDCLVSNGTAFVPGSCGAPAATYYQRMQRNGTLFPQQPFLNFDGNFFLADNPGSTRTDVGLQPTPVTAGSYTNTNLTVDAFGRIQAATNGPAIPVQKLLIINSGICSTGTGAYTSCNFTATWPGVAFADTAYVMGCTTPPPTSGVLNGVYWGNKTTTGFTVYLQNGTSSGAAVTTVAEVDCWASHP